jgi:hypothetical protein
MASPYRTRYSGTPYALPHMGHGKILGTYNVTQNIFQQRNILKAILGFLILYNKKKEVYYGGTITFKTMTITIFHRKKKLTFF